MRIKDEIITCTDDLWKVQGTKVTAYDGNKKVTRIMRAGTFEDGNYKYYFKTKSSIQFIEYDAERDVLVLK